MNHALSTEAYNLTDGATDGGETTPTDPNTEMLIISWTEVLITGTGVLAIHRVAAVDSVDRAGPEGPDHRDPIY